MDVQAHPGVVEEIEKAGPCRESDDGRQTAERSREQPTGQPQTTEGTQHPGHNSQFEHINRQVKAQRRARQPALSFDTKKKENIGSCKNPGQTWRQKGEPIKVKAYDFPDKTKGKAVPYGVSDIEKNGAWVHVSISYDTAQFAVASIRAWWQRLG